MTSIADHSGNVLAVVDVVEYVPRKYKGRIISSNFPEDLTHLLNEFQELAESQVFSLIDEVAERIAGFALVFTLTGSEIHDLQVYNGELISFQV